ncbi:MAG: hypothetical protein ACPGXK_00085 [Phycisphaerae bacterium]
MKLVDICCPKRSFFSRILRALWPWRRCDNCKRTFCTIRPRDVGWNYWTWIMWAIPWHCCRKCDDEEFEAVFGRFTTSNRDKFN